MNPSNQLPNPWPGLFPNGTVQESLEKSFTIEYVQQNTSSVMSATRRIRYLLRGLRGYATETGYTLDPTEAIQLSSSEAATKRIMESGRLDLLPHPVEFEKINDTWHPITK